MTDIAPISLPAADPTPRLLARGLLVAAGLALWLLFLPALLARPGTVQDEQGCRLATAYRDPVTGRTTRTSQPGIALAPCPQFRP
ncbi:MAG: hypothetical protein DI527_14550 [Chelatococcus sp.]|nr:MAG: hypothetical protein DI527_14550 [Chelatococcus sp.]